MKLHFDATLVQRLLDHSKAATTRAPTLDQLFEGRFRTDGRDLDSADLPLGAWPTAADIDPAKLPAGLWLVGDQGIYLMSNGRPGLLVDPSGSANVVAHATEADPARNPDTWWDVKRTAFGGDDGVVFLDLAFVDALLSAGRDQIVCIDLGADAVRIAQPQRIAARRPPT